MIEKRLSLKPRRIIHGSRVNILILKFPIYNLSSIQGSQGSKLNWLRKMRMVARYDCGHPRFEMERMKSRGVSSKRNGLGRSLKKVYFCIAGSGSWIRRYILRVGVHEHALQIGLESFRTIKFDIRSEILTVSFEKSGNHGFIQVYGLLFIGLSNLTAHQLFLMETTQGITKL